MIYEALLLASEVILSAYPILIKLVDTSITFQTGLRMILYTVLATFGAFISGSPILAQNILSVETLATGALNLLHVGASYTAFEQLTAGNAMALFYTYPVWNIVGSALVYGETIPMRSLPWLGLAVAGAVMLSQPTIKNWTAIGVAAALTAALTETGIYLWFKKTKTKTGTGAAEATVAGTTEATGAGTTEDEHSDQPWTKMAQMYGSSGILWIVGITIALSLGYLSKSAFKLSTGGLGAIVAFNSFIGFVGYALRFYIIPKVSTIAFSAMSFFGVLSAYGLGWLFMGESATAMQAAGAAAIIAANAVLLRNA
jgi:drug/metabolite transporter (DMT)-like permease